MLERFIVKPIGELIHGKTSNYDFNISKDSLPLYFETASIYSQKDLKLILLAKGGDTYVNNDGCKTTLYPDSVRIRVSTREKGGRTDVRRDFFAEVSKIRERIKEGKWQISVETQRKVDEALGNPFYNG